jgi:uncharacterized protein (TIGR02145 family)
MAVTYSNHGVIVRQNTVKQVAYTPQQSNSLVIDNNGYIGYTMPACGTTYYAAVDTAADYSNEGLGQVSVIIPEFGTTVIGGKTYKTTTIGTQTWLCYNLDLTFTGLNTGASSTSADMQATYLSKDESIYGWNARKYGLMYNWYAVHYMEENKSTLFPGWHIPTYAEWNTLGNYLNNVQVMLQSTDYWVTPIAMRIDLYEMRIVPGGYCYPNFTFNGIGVNCTFWSPDESLSKGVWINSSPESPPTKFHTGADPKYNQFYVRLIKDAT